MLLVALSVACEAAAPAATTPSPRPTTSSPPAAAPSPSPPAELKVAFIRDLAPEEALAATTPAQQAVELAFATASLQEDGTPPIEVVAFDTQGDPARAEEIASEVAADPSYVAAIAGPNLAGQASLAGWLGQAGIPLLSLSARGTVEAAAPGTWLRLVAPVEVQATALARSAASLTAAQPGVCVITGPPDGSVSSRRVLRSIAGQAAATEVLDIEGVAEAGCGVVVWTGDAAGGARIAAVLADLEDPPTLIGDASLLEPEFLRGAGAGAEGTRSLCSCADVSTSLDLAAQRFIQDFQSEYGSPPGPYAVEAWDGAHLLIRGFREAGTGREDVRSWLAGTSDFGGLGGTYSIRGGELADPGSAMHRYRVVGDRWVVARRAGL